MEVNTDDVHEFILQELGNLRKQLNEVITRQRLSSSVKPPRFSGKDPTEWICAIQWYFDYCLTPESDRLHLVSWLIDSPASEWFCYFEKHNPEASWQEFLAALRHHFAPEFSVDILHIVDEKQLDDPPLSPFHVDPDVLDAPIEGVELHESLGTDTSEASKGGDINTLIVSDSEQPPAAFSMDVDTEFQRPNSEMGQGKWEVEAQPIGGFSDDATDLLGQYGTSRTILQRNGLPGEMIAYEKLTRLSDLMDSKTTGVRHNMKFYENEKDKDGAVAAEGKRQFEFLLMTFEDMMAYFGEVKVPGSEVYHYFAPELNEEAVVDKVAAHTRKLGSCWNYLETMEEYKSVVDVQFPRWGTTAAKIDIDRWPIGIVAKRNNFGMHDSGLNMIPGIEQQKIPDCLVRGPLQRSYAQKLLKHNFFKQAIPNDYTPRTRLVGVWCHATLQFGADKGIHIFDPGARALESDVSEDSSRVQHHPQFQVRILLALGLAYNSTTHRDFQATDTTMKVSSTFKRFVLIVSVFVVSGLTMSYMTHLTSFRSIYHEINDGDCVGYLKGSFVSGLLSYTLYRICTNGADFCVGHSDESKPKSNSKLGKFDEAPSRGCPTGLVFCSVACDMVKLRSDERYAWVGTFITESDWKCFKGWLKDYNEAAYLEYKCSFEPHTYGKDGEVGDATGEGPRFSRQLRLIFLSFALRTRRLLWVRELIGTRTLQQAR